MTDLITFAWFFSGFLYWTTRIKEHRGWEAGIDGVLAVMGGVIAFYIIAKFVYERA